MPSWSQTLRIASLITREIKGDDIVANAGVLGLSVWPHTDSGGRKAIGVMVYPTYDVHFALDAAANTIGEHSAKLVANLEYVFPLHPAVATISFVLATDTSVGVYVRWILGG